MQLRERIEELHRRIEQDEGPGTFLFCAVVCNGCGRRASAPTVEKLIPQVEGWWIGPWGGPDYCPVCS